MAMRLSLPAGAARPLFASMPFDPWWPDQRNVRNVLWPELALCGRSTKPPAIRNKSCCFPSRTWWYYPGCVEHPKVISQLKIPSFRRRSFLCHAAIPMDIRPHWDLTTLPRCPNGLSIGVVPHRWLSWWLVDRASVQSLGIWCWMVGGWLMRAYWFVMMIKSCWMIIPLMRLLLILLNQG